MSSTSRRRRAPGSSRRAHGLLPRIGEPSFRSSSSSRDPRASRTWSPGPPVRASLPGAENRETAERGEPRRTSGSAHLMSTQTTPERARGQANGAAVALAPQDRRQSRRPQAPTRAGRGFTRRTPAGDVVMAYLDGQAARFKALDPLVRESAPDSVHQMRVAVRRLRSTLQAYPAILPKPATRQLRAELKWLGQVLSEARDAEVLSDYLLTRMAGLPPELVLGPAQARVRAHFAPREASARSALLDTLSSARYYTLVAELDRLLADPPLTAAAAKP